MRTKALTITIFIFCLPIITLGQQAKLEGQVLDDKGRPVSGTKIIAPGGQAAVTDNKGHFSIRFTTSIQPGQATRIEIIKSNWVIYQPMFGECVTQSLARNYEPL